MSDYTEKFGTDADKISDLYQTLKQELPSVQVEQNILALAKKRCKAVSQPAVMQSTLPLKKGHWQRWQWPVSVAASALLVSVIFIDQYPMFTTNQTIYPEAVPVEVEAFSVAPPPPVTPDSVSTLQLDAASQQAVGQAVSEQPTQAQQNNDLLAAKHKAQQRASAEMSQRQKQSQQQQALQKTAMQQIPQLDITTKIARSGPADLNQAITSQIEYLQTELSKKQAMLAAMNTVQPTLLEERESDLLLQNSDTSNQTEQQALAQQINDLQNQLIKQMHNRRRLETNWQAPPSLLNLLSAEQQAKWLKPMSDADQHKQENKQ